MDREWADGTTRVDRRRPPSQLRYGGGAAVIILWGCVAAGMDRTGLGFFDDRPVSYLGTDPRSALVFRGGLVAAAVLMAGFAWFVGHWFASPRSFLVVFLTGLVGQVVAAGVRLTGPGPSHAVHTVGGLVLGASLPLLMWRFAAGLPVGSRRRAWGYGLCRIELAACVVGVGLSASGRAPIAEIVPALGFHLWVAVVTAWSAGPGP